MPSIVGHWFGQPQAAEPGGAAGSVEHRIPRPGQRVRKISVS